MAGVVGLDIEICKDTFIQMNLGTNVRVYYINMDISSVFIDMYQTDYQNNDVDMMHALYS